jgi:hypothetical protein
MGGNGLKRGFDKGGHDLAKQVPTEIFFADKAAITVFAPQRQGIVGVFYFSFCTSVRECVHINEGVQHK